jgi:hypothetical protein
MTSGWLALDAVVVRYTSSEIISSHITTASAQVTRRSYDMSSASSASHSQVLKIRRSYTTIAPSESHPQAIQPPYPRKSFKGHMQTAHLAQAIYKQCIQCKSFVSCLQVIASLSQTIYNHRICANSSLRFSFSC